MSGTVRMSLNRIAASSAISIQRLQRRWRSRVLAARPTKLPTGPRLARYSAVAVGSGASANTGGGGLAQTGAGNCRSGGQKRQSGLCLSHTQTLAACTGAGINVLRGQPSATAPCASRGATAAAGPSAPPVRRASARAWLRDHPAYCDGSIRTASRWMIEGRRKRPAQACTKTTIIEPTSAATPASAWRWWRVKGYKRASCGCRTRRCRRASPPMLAYGARSSSHPAREGHGRRIARRGACRHARRLDAAAVREPEPTRRPP